MWLSRCHPLSRACAAVCCQHVLGPRNSSRRGNTGCKCCSVAVAQRFKTPSVMTINAALVAAVALPSSTSSGSSSLLNLWYSNVPQAIRFFTAGNVGTIFFYVFDSLIYKYFVLRAATENWPKLLRRNKESVSFFLAYLSQISAQHLLNAWLVYGMHTIATKERYLKTLRESYAM